MLIRARSGLASPDALVHVLVLLAATVWLLVVTASSGGLHDTRTATLGAVSLCACLAVRPWQHVPVWIVALPVVAACSGLAVLLTTRTGWQQADSVADQVLGLVSMITVAGYARTPRRRELVGVVLAVGLGTTSLLALRPWFGSGDPNHLITAPFDWHNQTAAFIAGLTMVVGATAVHQVRVLPLPVHVLLAGLGAGILVLTTSRSTLGLFLLAWLAVGVTCFVAPRRRRTLGLWLALPCLTLGLLLVGTSGLFFDRPWAGPPLLTGGAGVSESRGTETVESNGSDRVEWTRAALHSFAEHPLSGDGFGSFLATSDPQLAPGRTRSTFVHNGYAEALASGGLIFGLPVLAGAGVVAVAVFRTLRRRVTDSPEQPLLLGVALGAGLLLLHSAVDFDAHYASLQVLLGVLGGVLLGAQGQARARRPAPRVLVAAGLTFALATVAFTTLVEHHGRVVSRSGATASELLDAEWPGLRDPRLEEAALAACLDASGGLAVPVSVARRALAASSEAAGLLPEVRDLRGRVMLALGN